MKVRFLSPANYEMEEAISYYEDQLSGLGFRFYEEVDSAIDRIKLMPEAWTKIGKKTRRCILKGFPYAVLYVIEPEEIIVTAIANLHRDPDCYKGRICYDG